MTQLRSFPVPLAPAAEQIRIMEDVQLRFSVIEEVGNEITSNLKKSRQFRQAILHNAYSGTLVAQNRSDEPAAALLQRIREERQRRAEAEIAERKIRVKPSTAEEKDMETRQKGRLPLLEVLTAADSLLSPEELFERAAYTVEFVDEFYEELRRLTPDQVNEIRGESGIIRLKAVTHANQAA